MTTITINAEALDTETLRRMIHALDEASEACAVSLDALMGLRELTQAEVEADRLCSEINAAVKALLAESDARDRAEDILGL